MEIVNVISNLLKIVLLRPVVQNINNNKLEVVGRFFSGTEHWLLKTSFHPANSWTSSGLREN